MIPRYTRPAMGQIWSDENKFRKWLEVELAASEALAEIGEVPTEAAQALRQHADFDVGRIHEIEGQVKHDVIAFTTAVAEKMSAAGAADASRWFHYGLTSNDVVDTAQALQIKDASELIQSGPRRTAPGAAGAGFRVPAHRDHWAHPRGPRGTDDIRTEDSQLVCRG